MRVAWPDGPRARRRCAAGPPQRAVQGLALEPLRKFDTQGQQGLQVEAGRNVHRLQHPREVFGGDVAAGPGRVRTAANAPETGVKARDPLLQRCKHVGHAEAARVVEMRGFEAFTGHCPRLGKQLADAARIGIAHGVREADTVGAGIEHGADEPQHLGRLDAALDRAAERGADADLDPRARATLIAQVDDARNVGHHRVGRTLHVGQAVRVAGRQRHEHRVGRAVDCQFGALEVGHQHGGGEPGQRLAECNEFSRVGELRHQPRRHERTHLDLAHTGRMGGPHPLDLVRRGHDALQDLQAVAQADFADARGSRPGSVGGKRWVHGQRRCGVRLRHDGGRRV